MRVFREIFALGDIFRLPHRLQTALLDAIDPLRASAIRAGSSMAAMILKSPPHCGQCSESMSNTRLSRRTRHQRGQALHEFQRQHLDVRGAVAPGALELQHDITSAIALESFVGDRGARDVAAQAFKFLTLMGATAYPSMQAEAMRISAQRPRGFLVPAGHGAQAQHLLSGARPQRNPIGAGGSLQ